MTRISKKIYYLSLLIVPIIFFIIGCSLPKYATINSEQPPSYYLGDSPNVRVVEAEGATRRLQDITIQELRNQSRSRGYFIIQNELNQGIRFDIRQGKAVMTGTDINVSNNDVFIKVNIIASMSQDGRTVITRQAGILGSERQRVPAMVTEIPVAFTVAKGGQIILDERQYNGRAVWALSESGGGYPSDYSRRLEIAVKSAVNNFLTDITPRTVSRRVRLDYSDENQESILDAARDGQVKEAIQLLENYVKDNPNSSSAVYNLAVLTDALGNFEKAITLYDKALSLGGKDYYTEAKASCMKRLNERREMGGTQSRNNNFETGNSQLNTTNSLRAGEESTSSEVSSNSDIDVAWVQNSLNQLGYNCGVEDGIMGPNTRKCIRAFQKNHDLNINGRVNDKTYNTILAEIDGGVFQTDESTNQLKDSTAQTKESIKQASDSTDNTNKSVTKDNINKPSGSPSEQLVKKYITESIENGGLNAFCASPEVRGVKILEWGKPREVDNTKIFPIRTETEVQCSQSLLSDERLEPFSTAYEFWQDEFDDWQFQKTSF